MRADRLETGATLVEALAALFIASALLVGLIEVSRRFVSTTAAVASAAVSQRHSMRIASFFERLARIEPGSLDMSAAQIHARIGRSDVSARITLNSDGRQVLLWSSSDSSVELETPKDAYFDLSPSGAIRLMRPTDPVPILVIMPRRHASSSCQFDPVSRACR